MIQQQASDHVKEKKLPCNQCAGHSISRASSLVCSKNAQEFQFDSLSGIIESMCQMDEYMSDDKNGVVVVKMMKIKYFLVAMDTRYFFNVFYK